MALIGQCVDIPKEILTVDYMVRGPQMAVHQLVRLGRQLKKPRKGGLCKPNRKELLIEYPLIS